MNRTEDIGSRGEFRVKDGKLTALVNGREVYSQSFGEMVCYSLTRPWELKEHDWRESVRADADGTEVYVYRDDMMEISVRPEATVLGVQIDVEYKNISGRELCDVADGFTMDFVDHGKNKITIPHLIYNDNPSADPERIVPHIGEENGLGTIVEEHRLPIPAVNMEWQQDGGHVYMTFLSKPDVPTGDNREYWSLGVLKEENGHKAVALSGPLMFNGMVDVVYGGRNTPLPYLTGYRYMQPEETLRKTFYVSCGATEEGKGFRDLVALGYGVLQPVTRAQHTYKEMIRYKKQVTDTRYYKDDTCAGYLTFGAANSFGNISRRPEYFLYGWTGQAIKLAWCDCVLGLKTEETFRLERAMEIVDFFVKNGQSPRQPGLFRGYYMIEAKDWRNGWKTPNEPASSRIEGEALVDLIEVMKLLRSNRVKVPEHWEQAVKDACSFLMSDKALTEDGAYPMNWNDDGTVVSHAVNAAGISCIWALAKASEYFREPSYLDYAARRYEVYYQRHMRTFDIPFAKATMDARCEDKEAGIYAFAAAAELYRLTREERFKKWASIAADWILTFVFFWETGFQKIPPATRWISRPPGGPASVYRTTIWTCSSLHMRCTPSAWNLSSRFTRRWESM